MLVAYHGEAGPRQRERFAAVARDHDLRIEVVAPDDTARLDALLGDLDVWWHVLTPINADHLAAAPRLRLVQKWGVGVNTIDVAAATRRGVAVANMPGSNAAAVAEATLLLILAVLRQLPTYHAATVAGRGWQVAPEVGERNRELAGSTVGLVGYGDIAQRLATGLVALGATVIHHSTRSDRPGWRSLDELLATADVVSLHVPLTDATAGLIDAARLASMRPGAVLVNTARGGLVDLDALAAALDAGQLAGAGLDVFPVEPWDAAHPVSRHPRVVTQPHVAWLTWETLERSLDLAVANVEAVRSGRPVDHRVN